MAISPFISAIRIEPHDTLPMYNWKVLSCLMTDLSMEFEGGEIGCEHDRH